MFELLTRVEGGESSGKMARFQINKQVLELYAPFA